MSAMSGVLVGLLLVFVLLLPKIFSLLVAKPKDTEEEVKKECEEPYSKPDFPRNLEEFIGQKNAVENLKITGEVYKRGGVNRYPHTLFTGPPGLGKTTLAQIVASDCHLPLSLVEGPMVDSPEYLLDKIKAGIIFIDEIHRVPVKVHEIIYKAMENFQVGDIILPDFTLIGATTDPNLLLKPFRDRFTHKYNLSPYTCEELQRILNIIDSDLDVRVSMKLSQIAQGTPRLLKQHLAAVQEYKFYNGNSIAGEEELAMLFRLKELNPDGYTREQIAVLRALAVAYPDKMGQDALASATGIAVGDITMIHEPYLVRNGLIVRTPRGRTITQKGLLVKGVV